MKPATNSTKSNKTNSNSTNKLNEKPSTIIKKGLKLPGPKDKPVFNSRMGELKKKQKSHKLKQSSITLYGIEHKFEIIDIENRGGNGINYFILHSKTGLTFEALLSIDSIKKISKFSVDKSMFVSGIVFKFKMQRWKQSDTEYDGFIKMTYFRKGRYFKYEDGWDYWKNTQIKDKKKIASYPNPLTEFLKLTHLTKRNLSTLENKQFEANSPEKALIKLCEMNKLISLSIMKYMF
jgi:hypothetical protein